MMSGNSIELYTVLGKTELLKAIECPICNEIPLPPIFMCITGHNICKHCKPKLTNCPVCKQSWSKTRNYVTEAIVGASRYHCPYSVDGCGIEPTGEVIEAHLAICKFRPFECPLKAIDGCGISTLNLAETTQHFLDKHRASKLPNKFSQGLSGLQVSFRGFDSIQSRENIRWPPDIFEWEHESFVIQIYTLVNTIRCAVMHIGREETNPTYRAKITFRGLKNKEISWTVPVESIMRGSLIINDRVMEKYFVANCNHQTCKNLTEWNKESSSYIFDVLCEITKN